MPPNAFDRDRLSAREDAILELAIEGLIDVQIAQRMDISQSTVNSYWVRIRGKLGQYSRTELVARALRQKAKREMDQAQAQLEALQSEAMSHARISADYANAEVYRAALDAMPEAIFVCCEKGVIRYANGRLTAIFGYPEGDLIGQSVDVLVPPGFREAAGFIANYLKDPRPMRIGFDRVVYAQRSNGTQFRVVLLIDARPVSSGLIYTCVVRDFTNEVETRRAFVASGWS